jgi:hypothetical protein
MIKCNCRLGLEGDLLGYAGFAPALTVRRPLLWQIETMSHWQARMMICKRKGYGDLTIVLLAQLAAILPCNTDRMPPFLGKARIIDDPSFDRPVAFDVRKHHLPNFGQNLLVRPVTLTDKMQQRLMLGCCALRRRHRRHGLDALAMARHHQTGAVIAKRFGPGRVPDHADQTINKCRKPRRHVPRCWQTHPQPLRLLKTESSQICDSSSAKAATL